MNKRFKKAFSLAELMVVILVIAFIATATMIVVKPFEKGMSRLYYKAYNSVYTAAYNVAVDSQNAGVAFPQTQTELCTALIKYINTSPINSNPAHCNNNSTSLLANSFTDTNLQFISTNAMKFYISPIATYNYVLNGVTTPITFRVVFVDLNGPGKPNSADYKKYSLPDIVGFAINDDGEAIPIGKPIIDTRYLSARICYPDDEENNIVRGCSTQTTYYDAQNRAWGTAENPNDTQSYKYYNSASIGMTSNLKVTFPAPAAVDTAKGCVEGVESLCTLEIEKY